MKFNVMHHAVNYYYTEMGETSVEFIPVENCTVIKVNDSTFVLPYGTVDYESLLKLEEHDKLTGLLEKVIGGIGISKYAIGVKEASDELNQIHSLSSAETPFNLLVSALQGLLQDSDKRVMSIEDYHDLVDDVNKTGNLGLTQLELSNVYNAGKITNPMISGYLIPAFVELVKQLDKSGLLQDIKDPALTMKRYRESKGMN